MPRVLTLPASLSHLPLAHNHNHEHNRTRPLKRQTNKQKTNKQTNTSQLLSTLLHCYVCDLIQRDSNVDEKKKKKKPLQHCNPKPTRLPTTLISNGSEGGGCERARLLLREAGEIASEQLHSKASPALVERARGLK